jgi:hypothetical protein
MLENFRKIIQTNADTLQDNLTTDFDPTNENEIRFYTQCTQVTKYSVNLNLGPALTIVNMPDRYMPIHRCMHYKLEYQERVPIIGPHRPLWVVNFNYSPIFTLNLFILIGNLWRVHIFATATMASQFGAWGYYCIVSSVCR